MGAAQRARRRRGTAHACQARTERRTRERRMGARTSSSGRACGRSRSVAFGHLLDVALGRPNDAVGLLAEAYKREPKEPEIASSYAHALARAGKLAQAKK